MRRQERGPISSSLESEADKNLAGIHETVKEIKRDCYIIVAATSVLAAGAVIYLVASSETGRNLIKSIYSYFSGGS